MRPYLRQIAGLLTVGSLGLAVSVILGPERVTPAKILELVIPAVDILSSQ